MAVKLIAMDLDGTLLNREKLISPENQRALEDAHASGIKLAVSTGRALSTIPVCVRDNPVFSYYIASNGAEVYRRDNGECIYSVKIKPDSVDRILEITEGKELALEAFVGGYPYAQQEFVDRPWEYGVPSSGIAYIKRTRRPVPDIRAFIREHREHMSVIDMTTTDEKMKEEVIHELQTCGGDLYVTSFQAESFEVLSAKAGKGIGLKLLCEQEGIDAEDTAAIGDADNDLDMIRYAGMGIAMGNADDFVKENADRVTADYTHHGVAEAFRKILGILSEDEKKKHERYMKEALKEAGKAEALDEVPIGCVIVKDEKIIARGYNRRNTDQNTLSHAELNAIRKASKKLGDWRLEGCTMYITLEPCQMCAGALVQSRIDRIVLGGRNPKAGCAGSVLNLLQVEAFNHQVEIVDGILTEECSRQLSDFFQRLRDRKTGKVDKIE